MKVTDIHAYSESFARTHLKEMTEEVLEWSQTGVLREGKLRELAAEWQEHSGHASMAVAQTYLERAAYEFVRSHA